MKKLDHKEGAKLLRREDVDVADLSFFLIRSQNFLYKEV